MDIDRLRESVRSLMLADTGPGDRRKWKKPRGKMEGVEKGAVLGAGIGAAAGTGLGYVERLHDLHRGIRELQDKGHSPWYIPFSLGSLDNLPVAGLSPAKRTGRTVSLASRYIRDLAELNRRRSGEYEGLDNYVRKGSVVKRGIQGAGVGAGAGIGLMLLASLLDRKLAEKVRKQL